MSPPSTLSAVQIQLRNGVALITYNRPKSGNSLSADQLRDMRISMQWAEESPDVKVIVHTGAGRFFCTGMELAQQTDSVKDAAMSERMSRDFHDYNAQLINCTKPLIAAVNGPAVGYGTSTLGLFDIVYSVPQAYFFMPFVKWGLVAEGGSSVSFAATMGYQKAAWLILTGERVGAAELERAGLISKILPEKEFLQAVLEKAELMAQSPPETLKVNKEIIRAPMRQALLSANDRECEVLKRQMAGEESKVALGAFAEEQEKKKKQAKLTPKL